VAYALLAVQARGECVSENDRPGEEKVTLPYASPLDLPEEAVADREARRPAPPRHVVFATWLMWTNGAFALVALVVAVATPAADYLAAIRGAYPDLPADQIARLADAARTFSAVSPSIFLASYLALTIPLRRGRRWARLVTWFLAGLGLVSLAAQADSIEARSLSFLGAAIDLGIILLLATKQSRAFFPKRQRLGLSEVRKAK
jgi:hypothetical protein